MAHSILRVLRAATAAALGFSVIGAAPPPSPAEDMPVIAIMLKGHHFTPAEIHVPAGKSFFVSVTNADDAAEEFEMLLPPVERVIPAGGEGQVRIRPLAAGRFLFFGESNPDDARGVFIAE